MISKTVGGELVRLTAEIADVDLYVCGFMCTPFTRTGCARHGNMSMHNTLLVNLEDHQSYEASCLPAGECHGHLQQLEQRGGAVCDVTAVQVCHIALEDE